MNQTVIEHHLNDLAPIIGENALAEVKQRILLQDTEHLEPPFYFTSPHTVTLGYGETAKMLPIRHLNGDDELHVLGMVKTLILGVIEAERYASGNFLQHKHALGEFFYGLLAYCINMPGQEKQVSIPYLKACSDSQRIQAARVVLEANGDSVREVLGVMPGWVRKLFGGLAFDLVGQFAGS